MSTLHAPADGQPVRKEWLDLWSELQAESQHLWECPVETASASALVPRPKARAARAAPVEHRQIYEEQDEVLLFHREWFKGPSSRNLDALALSRAVSAEVEAVLEKLAEPEKAAGAAAPTPSARDQAFSGRASGLLVPPEQPPAALADKPSASGVAQTPAASLSSTAGAEKHGPVIRSVPSPKSRSIPFSAAPGGSQGTQALPLSPRRSALRASPGGSGTASQSSTAPGTPSRSYARVQWADRVLEAAALDTSAELTVPTVAELLAPAPSTGEKAENSAAQGPSQAPLEPTAYFVPWGPVEAQRFKLEKPGPPSTAVGTSRPAVSADVQEPALHHPGQLEALPPPPAPPARRESSSGRAPAAREALWPRPKKAESIPTPPTRNKEWDPTAHGWGITSREGWANATYRVTASHENLRSVASPYLWHGNQACSKSVPDPYAPVPSFHM